jgi:aspartate semialdehyde dehydrogenase (EC 1.2.1.11)
MSYKIAVIGATGAVGQEVLNTLAERQFPYKEVVALASSNSRGQSVSMGDEKQLIVQDLVHYDFSGTDFAFFCVDEKISKDYALKAAAAGTIVIDKSSYFRMEPGVPLVVPEVNGNDLTTRMKKNIIANPNCVAIPLAMVLKPLHDLATVKRVVISTYQSVSGAGQAAMDELFNATKAIFVNQDQEPQNFTKPIAFNVIPAIGSFNSNGVTGEEEKIIQETNKILGGGLKITATCVRVPVFVGHSIAATIEFEEEISAKTAQAAYKLEHGVMVIDNPQEDGYFTPLEISGEDIVVVSRIRQDTTVKHGLSLWIVGDNLRKGAALNAVQIAESLVKPERAAFKQPAMLH